MHNTRGEELVSYDGIVSTRTLSDSLTLNIERLNDKVIAITGGAGSIGSQVAKVLATRTNSQIWILDNDESRLHSTTIKLDYVSGGLLKFLVLDIKDPIAVDSHLSKINPDIIIHAAALKHVPILENQPRDGYMTNIVGTKNIASFVEKNQGTRLCFISTDKAANPISVLGKTKLIGEFIVAGLNQNQNILEANVVHNVVRFGNVFMSRGSVVETFIHQLSNGIPVTISDSKMKRYFMDINEAASLICHSIALEIKGVSILKMGEPISITLIAEKIAEQLKIDHFEYKEIGMKRGEKLNEDLFSEPELANKEDLGDILRAPFTRFLSLSRIPDYIENDEIALRIIDDLLDQSHAV